MLRKLRSHGLDIDAHQRAEPVVVGPTSVLVGRIYVRVYARAETDNVSSSTNAFTNLFSSMIVAKGDILFRDKCLLLNSGCCFLD